MRTDLTSDLWLWHRARARGGAVARPRWAADGNVLWLDTCMRQLALGLVPRPAGLEAAGPGGRLLAGAEAYRFALEVTTGLRSAVPGETNVFGQFKKAWLACQAAGPAPAIARLRPVVTALLQDTKAVRRGCLHGCGGQSYGSLVRRLLAPAPDEHVLFIGAGDLARSMLPLFARFPTALWNRHRPTHMLPGARHVFAPEQRAEAAAWAQLVVITTPPDAVHDAAWARLLSAASPRAIVHLGRRRTQPWPTADDPGPGYYDLDAVFALAADQDRTRDAALRAARLACGKFTQARTGPRPLPASGLLVPA